MTATPDIAAHYGSAGLTERILAALAAAGVDPVVDGRSALAGVDEFHLGGHRATADIAAALELSADSRVIDLGCGIGGAARHIAASSGCTVTGIDLTPAFVTTATDLTRVVGLEDRIEFRVGSATDIPADDAAFDAATVLHVGMNIEDKERLASELARVLRPGGTVVVYDIMRVGDGEISYPVPWASTPEWSFVETPTRYVDAMTAAGLDVESVTDRSRHVLDGLAAASQAAPPPATLSTLMGPDFPTMIGNLVPLVRDGVLAPTMVVARKPESDA